ncbi:nitrate- and nitrite sensing domain-containing protein [Nocardia sp. 2]|uniref:histidine kinase n=2 Tax=Nocardia acididurans TaxID=2802282 RepID=A0ABS1M6B7_9NOCA|nr:nitrate- and nitrite sensing domain-containing protein [Nocardia acididurans]
MVLISSVTLLVIGGGAAVYLVQNARESKQWAELASSTTGPAILMVSAFEEERRLSLLHLAGDPDTTLSLAAARTQSDAALAAVIAKGDAARELNPDGSADDIESYNKLFSMVPTLRAGVDSHQMPPDQVFGFFTQVIGTIISASMLAARVAPDARIAIELGYAVEQLRAAEALSQADTLGAVGVTTGEMSAAQLLEIGRLVGEFRGEVAYSATVLRGVRLEQLQAITEGAAWQQVTAMQDAILTRGPVSADTADSTAGSTGSTSRTTEKKTTTAVLPVGLAEWQEASKQVNAALQKLWEDQSRDAHVTAREQGAEATRNASLGGAAVLLIAALAFVAALVIANRFIARMRRLRRDTLELADHRMPEMIRRLGAGGEPDAAAEALDFGSDELGQVADAFNRAHVAAVSAAVAEAKTRAGVNAVFLNIAHRSQVVVHRQLGLLDRAEREERNADQLELLFQLDHLATRARRNAENLIILGGEQPGRRWRNPVLLLELARGAIAESLDYTRIHLGRLPELRISSHAVADVIHLLSELIDNATACSPPDSQVTVSGVIVGRGVAVEITDQGLGMTEAEFAERNAMLADPPDFSVATLPGGSRLGLFVVAKLAARHGISVKLAESEYGGVRAVVLIPAVLTTTEDPVEVLADTVQPVEGFPGRQEMPSEGMTAVPDVELPAARRDALRALAAQHPNALRSERFRELRAALPNSIAAERSAAEPGALEAPRLRESPRANEIPPGVEASRAARLPRANEASIGNEPDNPPADPVPTLPRNPGERPALPRRSRQSAAAAAAAAAAGAGVPAASPANPAVSNAAVPVAESPAPGIGRPRRTADEARNLMSAIAKGTRQGRLTPPESERGPQ